jgi:NAD(P)-dependent dehydrogenase (short-subunit alcohol dehydrogenase family)
MELAAAYAFVWRGTTLVLVAGREATLGLRALPFPADVTGGGPMRAVAAAAGRFGGIDAWINNANLSLWGRQSCALNRGG